MVTFTEEMLNGKLHFFFYLCKANLNQNRAHNDCCEVSDSLNSEHITAKVAEKVANTVENQKLKYVSNGYNNGETTTEFFKAFATSFGFGDRPEEIIYESKFMCQHLLSSLRNKRIEYFPVQNDNTIQRCKRKTSVIEVFCSCKQSYYPLMVMCTKCEEC